MEFHDPIDSARYRDYCFTLNNYTQDEFQELKVLAQKEFLYASYGEEVAPTTGTPHLQCYIYMKNGKNWSAMRKTLPARCANLARRYAKSTPSCASAYCKKDGKYFEFGELPKQGKRNDLENVKEIISTGGNMRQVTLEATSYQSVRMAECILKYHEPARNWRPEVYWFWGESGSGKSTQAKKFLGDDYWMATRNYKFWEGYDAHEGILFDEIRKGYMSFADFLVLIDENPLRTECKGGSRQCRAKKIVFTSPFHPCKIFEDEIMRGEESYQIIRRFKKIIQFKRSSLHDMVTDNECEYYQGMEI